MGHNAHHQPTVQNLLQNKQSEPMQPTEASNREQQHERVVPAEPPSNLQILRGSTSHVRERLQHSSELLQLRVRQLPGQIQTQQTPHSHLPHTG